MKKWMPLVLAMALGLPAFAQNSSTNYSTMAIPPVKQKDWKAELAQFQQQLSSRSTGRLWLSYIYNGSKVVGACSTSAAITVATFIADTLPVTNVLAETIGNVVTPDYTSYNSLWDTKNLIDLGRGTLGGGIVGMAETLEFVVLWLGGNDEQSWEALSKVYASTVKTAETLFAHQGQCLMSASKLSLVSQELSKRSNAAQAAKDVVSPADPTGPVVPSQQDPIYLQMP